MPDNSSEARQSVLNYLRFLKNSGFIYLVPGGASAPTDPLRQAADGAANCQLCKLCKERTQVVFGVGNPDADIMFVGEGPGRDEDLQGEPFVGRAGKLLTAMMEEVGLSRETVYITNVVKCRPPGNRDPEPDEVAACRPYLLHQIECIRPKVLIALGRFAAHSLAGVETPITKMRGRFHRFADVPVMPTLHPAAILRNPSYRELGLEDIRQAMLKARGK